MIINNQTLLPTTYYNYNYNYKTNNIQANLSIHIVIKNNNNNKIISDKMNKLTTNKKFN